MTYPRQEPSEHDYELAERRWKSIVRMQKDGKSISEICRNTGFKAKAIERTMANHGAGPEVAPPTPPGPPQGTPPASGSGLPPPGPVPGRVPMPPAPPAQASSSPMAPPGASQARPPTSPVADLPPLYRNADQAAGFSPTQNYDPANGATPVYPTRSPEQYASFGGGPPTGTPTESPLSGAYDIPDLYNMLYAIAIENGLKPTFAVGIIRQFRHFKANDYGALANILRVGGVVPQSRDSIVNAWKLENEHDSAGETSAGSPSVGTDAERIARLKRELGLAPADGGYGPRSELDLLEKRKHELDLQMMELALQEKRKAMGLPTTSSSAPDDETMEVVLTINGMPVPKRIRTSQFGQYAQWINPPASNQPREDPQVSQLAAQLAEMRRRDDERRENEIKDLRAQMNTPRGPSPEAERIRELEQQMAKDREDRYERNMAELKRQNDQTNAALARMSGPDYLVQQQRAEQERASALGYIPKSELSRLDESQIELEAKRKAIQRKDEAQAGLYEIGKEKLASTGALRAKVANSSMTDKLIERLAGVTDDSGDRTHAGAASPSPEEIQALMGAGPPPVPSPTPSGPPPGAAGQSGPAQPIAGRMQ
jgi:hypothetical protein